MYAYPLVARKYLKLFFTQFLILEISLSHFWHLTNNSQLVLSSFLAMNSFIILRRLEKTTTNTNPNLFIRAQKWLWKNTKYTPL